MQECPTEKFTLYLAAHEEPWRVLRRVIFLQKIFRKIHLLRLHVFLYILKITLLLCTYSGKYSNVLIRIFTKKTSRSEPICIAEMRC